jgi:hypothetical protein
LSAISNMLELRPNAWYVEITKTSPLGLSKYYHDL